MLDISRQIIISQESGWGWGVRGNSSKKGNSSMQDKGYTIKVSQRETERGGGVGVGGFRQTETETGREGLGEASVISLQSRILTQPGTRRNQGDGEREGGKEADKDTTRLKSPNDMDM